MQDKTREIVEENWNKWQKWLKEYRVGEPDAYSMDVAVVRLYNILNRDLVKGLLEMFQGELDTQKAIYEMKLLLCDKAVRKGKEEITALRNTIGEIGLTKETD